MLLGLIYVVAVDIYGTYERDLKQTDSPPDTRWICNRNRGWRSDIKRYIRKNVDAYSSLPSTGASGDASLMIFVSETKEY